MTIREYILCLILIIFSGTAFGQKEKLKSSKKRQSDMELLEQADALQETDPAQSIQLVEQVLSNLSKKKRRKRDKKRETEARAYILLGNIYENINQNKLALQRYEQALTALRKSKNKENQAQLFYRIGRVYLKEKEDEKAERYFTFSLKNTTDKALRQQCEEGLVDVELLRGNTHKTLSQLNTIESNYEIDSLAASRINAKRSQVYAQQEDYSNAYEALQNSINTIPKNQKLEEKDYEAIGKAKEDILECKDINTDKKIDVTTNFNISTESNRKKIEVPDELTIQENLQIASLYEDKKDFAKAEHFIKISKDVIDKNTAAASVAEVYKKSADINRKRGEIDAALADLEKYTFAKEESIRDLEAELKKQIEIVQGQQQIDLVKKDFDLEEKENELLKSQLQTQRVIIGLLGLLLLASLVFFYFLNKSAKAKRKANQLLLVKSLRTQMNPHFIFNALNSVNNFISKNDEKAANKFLSDFSRLMRKVLDYSQRDFISFEEEIELNELYLKLEHFRFRDKFEYHFKKNTESSLYDLEVPPMLIQPFIENAVWHGLRYKEGKGQLNVSIDEVGSELLVKIEDNGIGRKKSKELKTSSQKKYKSTGLENVSKRVALINEIYQKNYKIEVSDVDGGAEETGTVVLIWIPK